MANKLSILGNLTVRQSANSQVESFSGSVTIAGVKDGKVKKRVDFEFHDAPDDFFYALRSVCEKYGRKVSEKK